MVIQSSGIDCLRRATIQTEVDDSRADCEQQHSSDWQRVNRPAEEKSSPRPGFGNLIQDAFTQAQSINWFFQTCIAQQLVAMPGVFQFSGASSARLDMDFKVSHPRRIEFARQVKRHDKLCFVTVHLISDRSGSADTRC